ncbi:MAG: hypothetical protein DPW09_08055 [Anaerolineae bacterium]|nr:hypothetical protein [Anaerolineae bacterium]
MNDIFQQAGQTLSILTQQVEEIRQVVETRQRQLMELERQVDLSGIDVEAFQRFLQKPYLLRHLSDDRYELLIPRFLAAGFHPGWPLGADGEYLRFGVSRLIHLITPLPGWLLDELGYRPPDFQGYVQNDRLFITEGDPGEMWQRLGGKKTFTSRRGEVLRVRPKSRYQLLRDLVRQGILPYRPEPIPQDLLRRPEPQGIQLRPYQARDYRLFLEWGAVAVIAPGGAGKTFFGLYALAHLKGPKIVFAPRRAILEQWRARVAAFCPEVEHEVEFKTYQAMHRMRVDRLPHYSLVIYDEIQHLPSNMGVLAAQISSTARLGLSATPWREDKSESLIIALAGRPVGHDWESGDTPATTVWIVDREPQKLGQLHRILNKPVDGKSIIYVYRLNVGERLARELDVPFISGQTNNQLQMMQEHDTFVASKVADAGVSFEDVSRVIEYDRLGGRTELGQRGLRLRHGADKGEFHVLLTKDEYKKHSRRLVALYALDFDVQVVQE